MKKFILPIILAVAIGSLPVLAQEKKEMPMKEGMPMKGQGMMEEGMMSQMMKMMPLMQGMQKRMGPMAKMMGMGGMPGMPT